MVLASCGVTQGEYDTAIAVATTALRDYERLIDWAECKLGSNFNSDDMLLQDLERYRRLRDDCKANIAQLMEFKILLVDKV